MKRQSRPHHRGVRVGDGGLQAVVHHIVVGIGHPGAAAAVGTVRLGTVHQVLLAQGYELTRLLEYLSLNGSCSAEGPARAAVTLPTNIYITFYRTGPTLETSITTLGPSLTWSFTSVT